MMPQAQKKDHKLTISQTAKRLGCHVSTVRRYLRKELLKGLQYEKFGMIRIYMSEIERFENESRYQEPDETAESLAKSEHL
jgi:AraC-like DNA-binding protein